MPEAVAVARSFAKRAAWPQVHHAMTGPGECPVSGRLQAGDVIDRLPEI
jgi:hypothetical protein